jgi:hypothetical protein
MIPTDKSVPIQRTAVFFLFSFPANGFSSILSIIKVNRDQFDTIKEEPAFGGKHAKN